MIKVGDIWGGKKKGKIIRDVVELPNGWILVKTDNKKSEKDFKVHTVFSLRPKRSLTPKHAHFDIDFYGKLCADKEKTLNLLKAIVEVWRSKPIKEVMGVYEDKTLGLPGYDIVYILHALQWILEQEDINFKGRPDEKQRELDDICGRQGVSVPMERKGSQLAISVLCDIANGTHPVQALLKGNLDIRPRRRMG